MGLVQFSDLSRSWPYNTLQCLTLARGPLTYIVPNMEDLLYVFSTESLWKRIKYLYEAFVFVGTCTSEKASILLQWLIKCNTNVLFFFLSESNFFWQTGNCVYKVSFCSDVFAAELLLIGNNIFWGRLFIQRPCFGIIDCIHISHLPRTVCISQNWGSDEVKSQ